jgi:hypothetical protein
VSVLARAWLEVPARDVRPGDLLEIRQTSSGIVLPRARTLVIDVQERPGVDEHGDRTDRVWIRLDPAGVPHTRATTVLGTFLAPDETVEVWRT